MTNAPARDEMNPSKFTLTVSPTQTEDNFLKWDATLDDDSVVVTKSFCFTAETDDAYFKEAVAAIFPDMVAKIIRELIEDIKATGGDDRRV